MPRTPARMAALMASPDDLEALFYESLQTGDIDRLMELWSDEDEVVCVHPGGGRLVGLAAIRQSFETIFKEGTVPVTPSEVHRVQQPGMAVHSVLEWVELELPEGRRSAAVFATNVYVQTAKGWRIVAHHASPGEVQDATVEPISHGPLH